MKIIFYKILILSLFIVFSSCANQVDSNDCKSNYNCDNGYYCVLTTGKCKKENSNFGNLNKPCKANGECNQEYLRCSTGNLCVLKNNLEKQCHPNDRASCYTGSVDTIGKGICKPGYYICNEDSKWETNTCIKEVKPKETEICNNNLDDNCNGLIDENCDSENYCIPYTKMSCYTGSIITKDIGICKSGYKLCNENNKWNNHCNNEITPVDEICNNGLDDNCNGQIDEGCSCSNGAKQSCFSNNDSKKGIGNCRAGIQVCNNGIWGECIGQILPKKEDCNNKDDDCDGIIDNGISNLCSSICSLEIKEKCNGVDDNCNGLIDEGCSKRCLDYEVCGNFIDDNCNNEIDEHCYEKPECLPKDEEICNNIFDDDCNLSVNDTCGCESGSKSECYSGATQTIGVGECKSGTMTCIGGEFWDTCLGEVTPIPELCNGKDDDCDGIIDENFHVGEPCYIGLGECEKEGVFVCDSNSEGVICADKSTGKELVEDNSNASEELCDGLDNNCDGYIDEDFEIGKPCVVGYSSCQTTGITVCSDDKLSMKCNAEANMNNALTEICNNNKDDDCDGLVDEETGLELCGDGIDNNCNGLIDEQPCASSGPVVTCPTLNQVYQSGENKIYTLNDYFFTASATDPNGDALSYKWELISAPEGNAQYPTPDNLLTTRFTPYLVSNRMNESPSPYVLKFTATEKDTTEHLFDSCEVEFNVVSKDVFHVELIWSTMSDMDLHLVVPTGNENSFIPRDNNGIDCNYASCRGPVGLEWDGSDNLDNPYLDLDNTVGFGCPTGNNIECDRPENVNVPAPRNRVNEVYRIGIYAFEGIGENLKLKILCKSQTEGEFVVKEYYKDRLKSTSSNINRWWKPANIKWNGSYCTIEDN